MLELLTGYLKQLPDGSFVVRFADTVNSFKPIFFDLPLHPSSKDNEGLVHGKEVEFVIETIAIGDSEFDIIDCDVAKLLPFYSDASNYPMLDSIIENYPDEEFLKADGLDDAIIGVDEGSFRLIYSKSKCIDIFVSEGMEVEDALEHYYYNVVGSYVGEKTPIWCEDTLL